MIEFDPILVHDWLCRSAKRFPDKQALICGQERWTYKMLDYHTARMAKALLDMGIGRQDRVIIFLDNCCEAVISLYGILKARGVFVILEGSMKGPKLKYILKNSGARAVVAHTSKARVVKDALADPDNNCKVVIWVGPEKAIPEELPTVSLTWRSIFSELDSRDEDTYAETDSELPRGIDVDLACLIYTSGSTGEPKGVMSTHHNMISAARSIIQYIGNEENDVILNVLPLSFGYGLYQVIMAFMFGGTVVLEKSFIYLHNVLQRVAQEKVTGIPMVPTVVAMLLKMEDIKKYDLGTLRYITSAGAALPVKHIHALRSLLPHVKIFSMYGLTECIRVSYLPPEELDRRPASVGKVMPNCEVFIVDEEGKKVSNNDVGELVIRGLNVMQGYWNDPELTAKTYRDGSYPNERLLYSGDYFRQDDQGFLYFLGRKDDMIKTRGERVSPKEIEDLVCKLEAVAEASVVGVPDDILGQAIKVYIVPTPGAKLTEKDVLKYCKENMEMVCIPKYVEFIESLPKTPHGKVDKKVLKTRQI